MLVKQRLEWFNEAYANGTQTYLTYGPYLDYVRNRLSEDFRFTASMEEFFEYVIALETLLEEAQNKTAN